MNLPVSIEKLSPKELDLLHNQIMKAKMDHFQKEVELVKSELARVQAENEILKHRIDNVDLTNIEGTARDRLNRMIRLYAHKKGIYFDKAYHEFVQAFNTAYRTNLELRILNHCRARGIKSLSTPDYLERVGQIEDAIRVADKMLSRVTA